MRHQDLTLNHRLESWVYANAAARTGATGFVSGDVGRIAYQSDTSEYFRLTSIAPTWMGCTILPNDAATPGASKYYGTDGSGAKGYYALPTTATLQTAVLNPTATNSTTGVMMGLAAGGVITPVRSGKIFVSITGAMRNNTAGVGCNVQIRFGTGTPPSNGAAITGGALGPIVVGHSATANYTLPFNCSAVLTGQVLGTAVWFDLSLATSAAGTATIPVAAITAFELP